MSNLKQNGELRWIPSYLRRQGQMTPSQKRAYRDYWDRYGIEFSYRETIDLETRFPSSLRGGRIFLEIGFGMGENLVYLARRHPDVRILGIEVHKPGIGAALKRMADEEIDTVQVMRGDARLILSDYLAPETRFDQISILFPDPWPDRENARRRIVQSDLVDLMEQKINPSGHLHIATDLEVYRDHCLDVLTLRDSWELCPGWNCEDVRGLTRYEEKGIQKGHQIHDLHFRFRPGTAPASTQADAL